MAAERGLPNFKETVAALEQYEAPKNIELFTAHNVLSEREMRARIHVHFHHYSSTVRIEGEVALQLAKTAVLPAAIKHQQQCAKSINVS
mgnify:CR=1 FL=1